MFHSHFFVPLESLTTLDNSRLSNASPPSVCVAERAPAHHPKPHPESHIRKLKQRDQRVRSLFLLFAKKPARSCQKTWGPVNSNTQKDKNQYQTDPQATVRGEWRQPRVTPMTATPTCVTNCRVTDRLVASALSNCEEPPRYQELGSKPTADWRSATFPR